MRVSVSSRSRVIVGLGTLLAMLALLAIRSVTGSDSTASAAISNLPAVTFSLTSTIVILWAALRFAPDEPVRTPWIAIGVGMAATALGELTWAFYEVVLRVEVPYPGLADVFYLSAYVFFAAGLVIAIRSFRGVLPMGRSFAIAGMVCAATSAWLYVAVLRMVAADPETGIATKVVGLFYPLGDVWLVLFPALALAFVLSSLAGGRVSWPWWAVAAGFACIAVSDVLFTVKDWNGTYTTGSPLDAGWWIGYVLVALGASLLVDIQKPVPRPAAKPAPLPSQGVGSP